VMDMGHHRGEVDSARFDADAVTRGGPGVVSGMRSAEQRFAGHATGPQAVTADPVPLDEQHARPEPGRGLGRDQPRSAAAHHQQIPGDAVRRSQVVRLPDSRIQRLPRRSDIKRHCASSAISRSAAMPTPGRHRRVGRPSLGPAEQGEADAAVFLGRGRTLLARRQMRLQTLHLGRVEQGGRVGVEVTLDAARGPVASQHRRDRGHHRFLRKSGLERRVVRTRSRARDSRDITVPTGMSTGSATSA